MKRYLIKEAKCDVTKGGMACGPVGGNVVVSVTISDAEKTQYLSMVEAAGIPNFYLTDHDIFDDLVKEDFEDEAFTEVMVASYISNFEGIDVSDEYVGMLRDMYKDLENPAVPLLRYIIVLARCPMEDVEKLISMASGKYADEIEIPVSDVEEDYLEDLEDEED